MTVLNDLEKNYYRNIIDKNKVLVNEFNNDFIAKFVEESLKEKKDVEDVEEYLKLFNQKKEEMDINNKIIINYLKDSYKKILNGKSYKNIVELVNIIINSNIQIENYYTYLCIARVSNEICGFTSNLLILPSDKYITIINYKIFNYKGISKIDDFGRELLKEIAELFFYYYRKDCISLNENIDESTLTCSLERAFKLYNIYMHDTIKQGFNKEEPYKRKDYACNKFQDVLRIMIEGTNLDEKKYREKLKTNVSETELIRIFNELVKNKYISCDLDLFLSCFGYRDEIEDKIIWKSTYVQFEIFISEIVQKEENSLNNNLCFPRKKINLWFLDKKSKEINVAKKINNRFDMYPIYNIIHPEHIQSIK